MIREGSELAALVAKEAIRDCLLRYARGVDRVDEELIRSAFHPDATDHHGAVDGTPADFLAWWLPQQDARESTAHYLANTMIDLDLDGGQAHCETYYLCVIKLKGDDTATMTGGRYVDRFERRETGWRIAERVVTADWGMRGDGSPTSGLLAATPGARSRADPSYQRPLNYTSTNDEQGATAWH